MSQTRSVQVRVHVQGDLEDFFRDCSLSIFELAVLKGLIGTASPGVLVGVVVTKARKFDTGIHKDNASVILNKLKAKDLIEIRGRFTPQSQAKPNLSIRKFLHYSTKVDYCEELVCEPCNA